MPVSKRTPSSRRQRRAASAAQRLLWVTMTTAVPFFIEAVTPVLDKTLKQELTDMLHIQLADKRKACFVDGQLRNVWKSPHPLNEETRSQYAFYDYLKERL